MIQTFDTVPTVIKSGTILTFPVINDSRGKLAVVEEGELLPFAVRRVYYLFDVPAGSERGGHAHFELQQLIIAISGSFVVDIETEYGRSSFNLNRPDRGLYVGPMTWREIRDFSSNAVCLVLASEVFKEEDYMRSYETFERKLKDD